jgi:hypothetical protein
VAVLAVVLRQAPVPLRSAPAPGVVRWQAEGTEVVVLGGGGWRATLSEASAIEALRRAGVGGIDLLVVSGGDVRPSVVAAIAGRHPIAVVVVPADDGSWPSGPVIVRAPTEPITSTVGALAVTLAPGKDRVVVDARPVEGAEDRR